jgi:hypothetical protein
VARAEGRYDDDAILPSSRGEIERLARLMRECPRLCIEGMGHSDVWNFEFSPSSCYRENTFHHPGWLKQPWQVRTVCRIGVCQPLETFWRPECLRCFAWVRTTWSFERSRRY